MADFTDHYLKFTDEGTGLAALAGAGVDLSPGPDRDIDIVGTVWNRPVLGDDGEILVPATPQAGWHINLRLRGADLPPSLLPARQFPATPFRRFV